jgi:hypothetical protein
MVRKGPSLLHQQSRITAKDKDTVEHEFELVDLEAEDQTSNMQTDYQG